MISVDFEGTTYHFNPLTGQAPTELSEGERRVLQVLLETTAALLDVR